MEKKCIIVAISGWIWGPTASGKTTLAKKLQKKLGGIIFHCDRYNVCPPLHDNYTVTPGFTAVEAYRNYETPHAMRWDLLQKDLQLKRVIEVENSGSKYLFVEGFLLFYDETLYPMYDASIFIRAEDTESPMLCERRFKRDFIHHKYESFKDFWDRIMWPCHVKFGRKYPSDKILVASVTISPEQLEQSAIQFLTSIKLY